MPTRLRDFERIQMPISSYTPQLDAQNFNERKQLDNSYEMNGPY